MTRHTCQGCGHEVPILVDDGPLCIACDVFYYPHTPAA